MKKVNRKLPQSVKTKIKIDAAVEKSLAENKRFYDGVIARRDQKHEQKINDIKASFVQAVPATTPQGLLVANKSKSWAWFSNIAFGLIVAVQAFFDTLPPELIATLPTDAQSKITMGLAILGVAGRFINQSRKPKPLPEVGDH
ncbi:hypothetical protein [Acinetobacter nematophilus]|uniref:Holin of 3TMs, for gene-transfer release n=1 Tax=Acinetobacter nematophilus TaxID=2994642 RepID=A0A9X3IF79_9GAMM|nr:hypothetical protein [Acinetobacter nematophilus]MCX5466508.1 hypothetical protein [Acinetobacter nematophilus]